MSPMRTFTFPVSSEVRVRAKNGVVTVTITVPESAYQRCPWERVKARRKARVLLR
jgi:hypothetical protein